MPIAKDNKIIGINELDGIINPPFWAEILTRPKMYIVAPQKNYQLLVR